MDSVSRESGVLKLVYPRGFVETYKNPITAAEVMKRNPRHCVTRPDVFKFPWVVVKPESVLKPGRVFYVVPYHTLHSLLKSKGPWNKPFPREEDSDTRLKVTSWMDTWEHPESAFLGHDRIHRRKDPTESSIELTQFHGLAKKGNPVASKNEVNIKGEDWSDQDFSGSNFVVGPDEKYQNKFYRKQSLIQELKTKKDRSDYESTKKQNLVEDWSKDLFGLRTRAHLFLESKPLFSFQHASTDDDEVHALLPRYDRRPDLNSSQQITHLKSCLKKHNNGNKPRGYRVRFDLDEDRHLKKSGMHVHKRSP